jgi:hypothetical protein
MSRRPVRGAGALRAANSRARSGAPPDKGQAGAAAVEFAFALILVMLLFIAYYQTVMIFLAHARLSYAAFTASRAQQVHGNASLAASDKDKDYRLKLEQSAVVMEKDISVPIDFFNVFTGGSIRTGGATFTVSQRVKTFIEDSNPGGDN